MKYFQRHEDYPTISGELLSHGILYQYISHTFVNGFLNYSKPMAAYLMHRYEDDPEVNKTKLENLENLKRYHTNLGELGDDVLMLSKSEYGEYWYFWLNRDVSDCSIGRFTTDDTEEQVLAEFEKYTLKTQENLKYVEHDELPIKIDIKKIHGWIEF
jgi:hypothetical protein